MGLFKNEVGRPSNETIKKRNIFKGICFVLVLIIIGLVVLLLNEKGIININGGNRQSNDNTNVKANEKTEDLDVNSDEVKNLFNKYNVLTDSYLLLRHAGRTEYNFAYYYTKDKVSNNDISDSVLFSYSFYNLYIDVFNVAEEAYKKEEYKTIDDIEKNFVGDIEKVNKKSLELFGKKFNIENIFVDGVGPAIFWWTIKFKDDKLYISNEPFGEVYNIEVADKIISAYKKGNELIIQNKVAYIYDGPCDDVSDRGCEILYKNYSTNKEYVPNLTGKLLVQDNDNKISIESYLDVLDTYKWTFTKDKDGNYTFKSVEKVNS